MAAKSPPSSLAKTEAFFESQQELQFRKGEIILRANDNPAGVLYLKKGLVRLFAISPDGEELTLHAFRRGAFFPMSWALNETSNRYYFEALSPVTVYRAPSRMVINFLHANPDALFELTKRLMAGLDGYSTKIEHLVFDRAISKTASLLHYLSLRFGVPDNKSILIDLPLTHETLASWLGMTRVSVSQAMTVLKKQKLIAYRAGHVSVLDQSGLVKVR